jgi:hypothetical protein
VSCRFSISSFEFFALKTRTRFPFRYGIASMTEVPHLFVQARIVVGERESVGLASEGLPPKWFTKDPATTFEQDLPEMLAAIGHAANLAVQIAPGPVSFFELWRELYRAQSAWAESRKMAPLLANLGVSLIERSVLDAWCRASSRPLHQLLRENLLGLNLGEIYPELGKAEPRDLLPAAPAATVLLRHTVGLADPLTPDGIAKGEQVDDGLPQDLESCINAYGLRAFKIKLSGDAAQDLPRLRMLDTIIRRHAGSDFLTTVDGNENFKSFAAFQEFWRQIEGDPSLTEFRANVAVIEQPVHRNHALDSDAGPVLRAWSNHPPLIIDESDGAVRDLEQALRLGYAGVSHKNCKGIVKSIANAALLEHRRRQGHPLVLTAEDLCNLGPVALLQDLAIVALLGIPHVERNGHHYFRGLSMWPTGWQTTVLDAHGDLYRRHELGFPCVHTHNGMLQLGTLNKAPFGLQPLLDPSAFERILIEP